MYSLNDALPNSTRLNAAVIDRMHIVVHILISLHARTITLSPGLEWFFSREFNQKAMGYLE
jgi:hypothetical protein